MHPAMSLGSPLLRAASIAACAFAVAGVSGCGGSDGSEGGSSGAGSGKTLTAATDGAQIFKDATCSSCHTLAAADAKGQIGPNLDKVKPSADLVANTVRKGDGSMPAFEGRLSDAQIQAVGDYVADVAGQ